MLVMVAVSRPRHTAKCCGDPWLTAPRLPYRLHPVPCRALPVSVTSVTPDVTRAPTVVVTAVTEVVAVHPPLTQPVTRPARPVPLPVAALALT